VGILRRKPNAPEQRYGFADWAAEFFTFGGTTYGVMPRQTLTGTTEVIDRNFTGLVTGAYQSNGVVFACCTVRQMLFAEARFQFQRMRAGRPGDLYGTPELSRLETPWPGGTTGDLLSRMIQDADMAGNAFVALDGPNLMRLRPDWVTIVMGSRDDPKAEIWDPGTEVLGYIYQPGGPGSKRDPVTYVAGQVAHFAPIPDPLSPFRGMSWMQPIITEVAGDSAATLHKRKFFDNGATVNMAIVLDAEVQLAMFEKMKEIFEKEHQGVANAYKALFLGGGADVKTLGADFQQMDFKSTQGAGETRIAAAAGVHPTIVGLSEGLQGSSLNAGNFNAARRLTADKTIRPLWRNAAGSLASIIRVPTDSRLWYDARDVAFLQEDEKDAADIQQVNATSIKTLIDAGFEADSVIAAVTADDLSLLVHTGLFSVQLQPPGTVMASPNGQTVPSLNGVKTP
jgi:phage portal protein BeeE